MSQVTVYILCTVVHASTLVHTQYYTVHTGAYDNPLSHFRLAKLSLSDLAKSAAVAFVASPLKRRNCVMQSGLGKPIPIKFCTSASLKGSCAVMVDASEANKTNIHYKYI